MAAPSILEKTVTFTRTTDDGSVVVVTDVPATVARFDEAGDEVSFSLDVAERLEQMVSDALAATPGPRAKQIFSWADGPSLPPSDLELRFAGPNARYGTADIALWEKVTKRVDSAFKVIAREVRRIRNTEVALPRVAYVGSGSLRIGLRSRDYDPLFEGMTTPDEAGLEVLRIIAEAPMLLEHGATLNSPWEPRLFHAALRALEVLTPSSRDKNSSVEIIPSTLQFPNVRRTTLHADLIPAIRTRRRALTEEHESKREVALDGNIDSVSVDKQFHLREIDAVDGDWGHHTTADIHFGEDMFEDVVELFREKTRVRVYGVQSIAPGADARKLELVAIDAVETSDE